MRCGRLLQDEDFCPDCGTIRLDRIECFHHSGSEAVGVCVICTHPSCLSCGAFVNGVFLCTEHTRYEIIEGMVRVYGVPDEVSARYASACLEQEGLHPFVYSLDSLHGGARFLNKIYPVSSDIHRRDVNEFKVMVPCEEVRHAEEILKGIQLL